MVRVLVVDNNAEVLEVFVRLLERQPDIEVVAQAASLAEARGKLSGVVLVTIPVTLGRR
jgi:chemotaxis response regulator CheB